MIEQKVRSILRQQDGILETEKCGVVIANFRKDDDLLVVPVFNAEKQAIGLIDRQAALSTEPRKGLFSWTSQWSNARADGLARTAGATVERSRQCDDESTCTIDVPDRRRLDRRGPAPAHEWQGGDGLRSALR